MRTKFIHKQGPLTRFYNQRVLTWPSTTILLKKTISFHIRILTTVISYNSTGYIVLLSHNNLYSSWYRSTTDCTYYVLRISNASLFVPITLSSSCYTRPLPRYSKTFLCRLNVVFTSVSRYSAQRSMSIDFSLGNGA